MPQSADTPIQTTAQRTPAFVPLDLEQRTHVDMASAAHHLGRRPQTMRVWVSREQGPSRPVRINGRLGWPVAEIRRLLAINSV
jgi:hypothetical protein